MYSAIPSVTAREISSLELFEPLPLQELPLFGLKADAFR
jgi:hypothetical protein